MSIIGSPIETSLLQTQQAQQSAVRQRDKEKNTQSEASRKLRDQVELRIAGAEADTAVRRVPSNDSEQAEEEHQERMAPHGGTGNGNDDDRPRVDLTA